MRIDEVGEVGVYLTEANEPILNPAEKVIGFRELRYAVYRSKLLGKTTMVGERKGWVWQTSRRVLHLDETWDDLPGGKRGKRVHEYTFQEVTDVRWKRRAVLVHASGEKGKVVFEYKPFGAAARLFTWLREEKEERKRLARGESKPMYDRRQPSG